ncbi:MAG: hypothetical protein E7368_03605 [Clostridiales bacterium]|nr:hypothetical protein [Clostridiales bacterium]
MGKYQEYLATAEYAEEYMPSVEECGNYSSAVATKKKSGFLFVTYTVGLFLSYNEEEYCRQKEEILANRVFFQADDEDLESDCSASVDGYKLRLVRQEYHYATYKMGLLIGVNDAKQKICYLYYYDFDLDVLDNLYTFVKTYFTMP